MSTLVSSDKYRKKLVYSFIKRLIDIVGSFIGIVLLSPLLILIALLVKLTSTGPVIYGHKRIGRYGKVIKIYKFRSMKFDNRPLEDILTKEQLEEYRRDYKVTDDPRITKMGKILRKTSLDELPQLFNIFLGSMSIVGPRPVLQEETEKYGENRDLLLKVRPGLTGYWASHGRSNTTYEKRIEMELYYVIHRSFWIDVKIILKTAIGVFKSEGAK